MDKAVNKSPRVNVVSEIKRWIESGRLEVGAALPAERALSELLHVQRPTIRRAMQILENEGIIKVVGPRTRIVADRVRLMEHSIVVVSPASLEQVLYGKHQPGWTVKMANAVHQAVARAGYNLMVIHPDRVTESDLQRVIAGRPSGVIIPELSENFPRKMHWLEALKRVGIHVVAYGNATELEPYDRVLSDHEAGSYQITRYLIERGCRRILMLFTAGQDMYWVRQRRAGYERALGEAGLAPLPFVHCGPTLSPEAPGSLQALDAIRRHYVSYLMDYLGPLAAQEAIDGILTASDGDTFGIAAACRTLGAEPGRQILIGGYDNYWQESWERRYEPAVPVATIDKRNDLIGVELVNLLVDRDQGRADHPIEIRQVAPTLIETQASATTVSAGL